jgi:uncharacterized protein (TIGR00725 family)
MPASIRQPIVAVCGPGDDAHEGERGVARSVGRALAQSGVAVATGGLGGVMEAACRGAREARGVTIGLLPGDDAARANPFVTIPIVCNNGQGRNAVLIQTAGAVIAIGRSHGTLSEVALALRLKKPITCIDGYGPEIDGSIVVEPDPVLAADWAADQAKRAARG